MLTRQLFKMNACNAGLRDGDAHHVEVSTLVKGRDMNGGRENHHSARGWQWQSVQYARRGDDIEKWHSRLALKAFFLALRLKAAHVHRKRIFSTLLRSVASVR